MKTKNSKNERFTKSEELANAISHGIGLVFSIVASAFMVIYAAKTGSPLHVVSASIFGATMILLYTSSTLNHSLPHSGAKDFFHNFDQIAIYFLIAGTYTPLSLSIIRGEWGWVMFGIEWGFAFAGTLIKIVFPNRFERGVNKFIIVSYVIMGWLLLFFLIPIFKNMQPLSIAFIFAGGIFYSLGVVFFKMEKLLFSHLIWHLFVIAGTVFHWLAIFLHFKHLL